MSSILVWVAGLAYPVGNLILWHLVELERVATPDDLLGDPEPIGAGGRPAPEALTPLGWRRWHRARRFTRLGCAAWLVVVALWLIV